MRGKKQRAIANRNKVAQDHFPTAYRDMLTDKFDKALKFTKEKPVKLTAWQGVALKACMRQLRLAERKQTVRRYRAKVLK